MVEKKGGKAFTGDQFHLDSPDLKKRRMPILGNSWEIPRVKSMQNE